MMTMSVLQCNNKCLEFITSRPMYSPTVKATESERLIGLTTYYYCHLTAVFFQVIRSVGFPSGPPLFWKRTSANQWKGFIMGRTSFLIPNQTPKGKHSTNPNQWPRIILPLSTTRLLTEGALLHLCQLSDANISIARPNN